ncbi:ras GEF, partial [Suhomyces tanzawaensis NRRL Y-17324]
VQDQLVHPDFIYNKHNESIFDDERIFPCLHLGPATDNIVKFDDNNPELINSATLKALLVQLTSPEVIDYNLICDFFLTYRVFVASEEVMNLLLTRLIWALQYINSNVESNKRIGKLVLLRTFVVLRHWILNYFVDDFDPNNALCDLFVSTINRITIESNLICNKISDEEDQAQKMVFEKKILSDLKIHWLNLVNEFWKVNVDIDLIVQSHDILTYSLPSSSEIPNTKRLSKTNTEMSLHTNPSYRRSAMLSLYDKKALHKCIIFDDVNNQDENPQYSINNLLLQHQSSRQSLNIKLKELQLQHDKQGKSPIINNFQHNHMNLKDSSLTLKKTSSNMNTSIDKEVTDEPADSSPEDPVTTPKKQAQSKPKLEPSGFSTNGNVRLPNSKVTQILPPTPVKKMDYVIKGTSEFRSSLNGSPRKNLMSQPPHVDYSSNAVDRKKSIKKFMDGWKRTIINTAHSHNRSHNDELISHKTIDNEDIDAVITDALNNIEDEKQEIIGHRVDVLSARIIDELEYLLRYYIRNDVSPGIIIEDDRQQSTKQLNDDLPSANIDDIDYEEHEQLGIDVMGSPAKKPRISRNMTELSMNAEIDNIIDEDEVVPQENENEEDMDINDLSDLNIIKIDNLINVKRSNEEKNQNRLQSINPQIGGSSENFLPEALVDNSQESSFQKAASINWNDEGNLDLENSEVQVNNSADSNVFNDDGETSNRPDMSERMLKSATQYFDVSTELPNPPEMHFSEFQNTSNSFDTSISTPSNITQYDADIAELGIALSPQLIQQQTIKRISFNDHSSFQRASGISRHSGGSAFKRDSVSRNSNGSVFRRDSMKSYISYDSAFSASNGSRNSMRDNGPLKKMNGFNNLRTLAGPTFTERNSLDLPVRIKTGSIGSIISRSSSVRRSVRFSTLCALTELPFSNYQTESIVEKKNSVLQRSSKLSDVADSSIFSVAMKSRKNSNKTNTENLHSSNNSSANSIAIPGISSYVLKELAAIPDESFQSNDPIEFALFKLEGKDSTKILNKRALQLSEKSPRDTSSSTIEPGPNSTDEILNEIENANTEDLIDFSTQQDITQEIPLTPVKRRDEKNQIRPLTPLKQRLILHDPLTSTPNNDSVFFNPSNFNSNSTSPALASPKIILDNYAPSNDYLSVRKVMSFSSHISFVLGFDSQALANHFTIIEKDMLQEIDWKELIELKWNKELTPVNSWLEIIVNDQYYNKNKGVNLIIARFNLMVNWIVSEIILTRSQKERIAIISRFIHIAQKCYSLQNYSTLMQIILGLTSEKVQKLRETWKNLPPGDILMLKNLEELASPLKNFLNIRLCINQMKPSKGCIPFVGLYLSDLIFNAERPTFIKQKKTTKEEETFSPNTSKNLDSDVSESTINTTREVEKVINFSKFRTSVHIVKSLSQCIEWSSYYELEPNAELLSKCLYIKSLDEEEMNYCLSNL